MDLFPLIAAIEEGGLSFILFGITIIVMYFLLVLTIPK